MTYNHAYTLAFEVKGSNHPAGDDVTADQLRRAIARRLHDLPDDELVNEAVGAPFDTCDDE